MEKEWVYNFLVGLNIEYDQIRVQVISKNIFLSLKQTYTHVHVQNEKSTRNVML
jgi:hypothetical protein